jgi:Protein of unknown function (DUF3050).
MDDKGKVASHFELYLEAMEQIGAKTTEIKKLIVLLKKDTLFFGFNFCKHSRRNKRVCSLYFFHD